MMKRLFIGLPVSSVKTAQKAELWKNNSRIRLNKMNWIKPENWHITLYFLGDTPEEKVESLKQMIDQSFAGFSAFSAQLEGVGTFPNQHHPNVLWLGLNHLHTILPAYQMLGGLLQQNGLMVDPKPLKPHLTIARIKHLADRMVIDSLIKEYRQTVFDTINIDKVVLFESVLSPQGSIYKVEYTKKI